MTAPNTDARRFEAYLAKLAGQVKKLEEQAKQPQLGYSSLDDRNVVVTVGGEVRQVWGVQPGGSVGVANFNGPPPPRPNTPDVTGVLGGLDIAWNGELAGELPADFSHITVHVYFVDGFAWSEDNRIGTLFSKGSVIAAPLEVAPHFVRFVAWNTSGKSSEPSYQASGTPLTVVSDNALADIRSATAQAARDVAAATVATAVIGRGQIADQAIDTSKLADGSVSAAQLVANSITPDKVTFTARDLGSVTTFAQETAPASAIAGDTWAKTDEGNKLFRYSGTAWVLVQDSATALATAQNAQTAAATALDRATTADAKADGKVTVFYQSGAPGPGFSHLGDLWLNTSAGNKLYRYDGTTWQLVDDVRTAQALAAAQSAQSTADSKIDAFYQDAAPTGASVGDLWYATDNGNAVSRWNGSSWTPLPVGAGALGAASVTGPAIASSAVSTAKLDVSAVTAEKVAAGAIGVDQLGANAVTAGKIAANAVTAASIAALSVSADKIAASAISADQLAAQAVTADKIAALAVTADKVAVNAITSTKIAAGSINATHITTSLLLASQITVGTVGGARLELEGRNGSAPGLRLYNSSGLATFVADASTGSVIVRGEVRTADTGERVIIREDGSNSIRFYPSTGSAYATLLSRTFTVGGTPYGGVTVQGASYSNGYQSTLWITPDSAQLFRSNPSNGNFSGVFYAGDSAIEMAYSTGGSQVAQVRAEGSRVLLRSNTANVILNSSGSYGYEVITPNCTYAHMKLGPTYDWIWDTTLNWIPARGVGIQYNTTGIDVYNPANGAYKAVGASAFITQSAASTKTAIEALPFDPEKVILNAPSNMWEYLADRRDENGHAMKARKRFGPMADDLPALLQVPTGRDATVMGVDLAAQIGVVWAATGRQTSRLDDLDARLAALEGARA